MSTRRFVTWVLSILVAGVFVRAGAAKSLDPEGVVPVLHFLFGRVAPDVRTLLLFASGLGAAELALAVLVLCFPRNVRLWSVVLAVLTFYTGILLYLAMTPGAPECGCLGPTIVGSQAQFAGAVRNTGLLLATVLILGDRMRASGAISHEKTNSCRTNMPKRVQPGSRQGVTIVELLVVIAVIRVLIAIAMPSLQSAREQARLGRGTASLRHLGIATVAYSGEHRDSFPYLGVPGSPWEGLRIGGSRLDTSYYQPQGPGYFTQSLYYANLLVPSYFEVRDDLLGEEGVWLPTWNDVHFVTPFVMSGTAFAAPRYWEGEDTPDDLSLYRAVRLTEAVFPSSKGLILHWLSGAFDPRNHAGTVNVYHALAVDGAAGPHPMPSEEELDANSVSRPYGSSPQVISSTLGGMAGRDF